MINSFTVNKVGFMEDGVVNWSLRSLSGCLKIHKRRLVQLKQITFLKILQETIWLGG